MLRTKEFVKDPADSIIIVPESCSKIFRQTSPFSPEPDFQSKIRQAEQQNPSFDTVSNICADGDVLSVTKLVKETPRNFSDDILDIGELLSRYPQFNLDLHDKASVLLWKDIIKQASPKKFKNSMHYDENLLHEYHNECLEKLLQSRNLMRHIITVLNSNLNKKLILQVIGKMEGEKYITGGGSSSKTRRIILLYEGEGGIVAKPKRKLSDLEVEGSDFPLPVKLNLTTGDNRKKYNAGYKPQYDKTNPLHKLKMQIAAAAATKSAATANTMLMMNKTQQITTATVKSVVPVPMPAVHQQPSTVKSIASDTAVILTTKVPITASEQTDGEHHTNDVATAVPVNSSLLPSSVAGLTNNDDCDNNSSNNDNNVHKRPKATHTDIPTVMLTFASDLAAHHHKCIESAAILPGCNISDPKKTDQGELECMGELQATKELLFDDANGTDSVFKNSISDDIYPTFLAPSTDEIVRSLSMSSIDDGGCNLSFSCYADNDE